MLETETLVAAGMGRRSLDGRVAVVTGSTSGIGLGIARALAAEGAAVMLNGFGDAGEIERLRADLAAANGVKVAFMAADMSQPMQIGELARQAERELGPVDILVNNAGIQHVSPIEDFPVARWDTIVAVNLSAVFHLTRAVIGGMKARRWGRIVNIASAHGLIASPFKGAYVAAKHGVVGFTKVTALEGAEHGVTANAVCPGYVWTPLVEKQIEDQARAYGIAREQVIRDVLLAQQPNKRFATVEELGAVAAFLCSEAAASITGTAMPVDGGWVAH
ncbi:MAG TPA: 3-hydroxybutyrate dehydrogenase [Geminicoccaceae bacterium]|nr:3-hydroxybutyrate dehydrogenase [Geminicoccus sp.]HMU49980.1 3-hydroxybutyrate dehydrogenase [Geminicoccaceae bacterium]